MISFGVSPIAWINDDMPELGGDTPVETVLADTRDLGFAGIELGGKFPKDPTVLASLLARHRLELVGGWYSASLLLHSAQEEIARLNKTIPAFAPYIEAMKNGALDFIEKPFRDDVLIASIRRAVDEAALRLRGEAALEMVRARVASLSERELQVLKGVVAGLPNKTIALELDLSPRTVEVYRANLMSKMQAQSLPELVRMVMPVDIDAFLSAVPPRN